VRSVGQRRASRMLRRIHGLRLVASAGRLSRYGFRVGIHCAILIFLSGCLDLDETPTVQQVGTPPSIIAKAPDPPPPPPVKTHFRPRKAPILRDVRKSQVDESVITIQPSKLIGKEPSAVEDMLGSPASIEHRDVSVVWTYNYLGCAFQLYFYPDIKTSVFHALQFAGPSHGGANTGQSPICVRHPLMARSNGTN